MSPVRNSSLFHLALIVLCLLSLSLSARAGGDFPPLTQDEIRTFWKKNTNFDPNSYINNAVSVRKVDFFPTRAIRKSFLNVKVPQAVVDSLRANPHESAKFRFQVTRFADSASVLSAEQKTHLYELIKDRLQERQSDLSTIFQHVKETDVAVASVVDGVPKRRADGFPGPRIYLLGTIKKAGANVTFVTKLLFQSKKQETNIGKMTPLTAPIATEDDLKKAANKIVTEIYTQIEAEVIGKIP
jgi:hypothetical protein